MKICIYWFLPVLLIFPSSCKKDNAITNPLANTTIPVLITDAASAITNTTAVCGGIITNDGGAPITARGVCWGTNLNPTIDSSKTFDSVGTGSFSSHITGLITNTTYYVRAYATNIAGTGYGGVITFTTQGKQPYASDQLISYPKRFEIPGTTIAQSITFAPDGKTYYFVTQDNGPVVIKYSTFKDGQWTIPQAAEFCGQYSVEVPVISPDGMKIFYDQNTDGNLDIFVADKTETGWSNPRNLGSPINSNGFEGSPAVAANGNLYFESDRSGKYSLYRSNWENNQYSEPRELGAGINQFDVEETYIAPDESYLLFGSCINGNANNQDILISFNKNGAWTKAMSIRPRVNTNNTWEGRPCISPDGNYLFFTSHINNGDYIYQVDWKPILDSLKNVIGQ